MSMNCKWCKKEFIQLRHTQTYCSVECRTKATRERDRERERKVREAKRMEKNKKSALRELTIEARAHGMTYGQYVALKGI